MDRSKLNMTTVEIFHNIPKKWILSLWTQERERPLALYTSQHVYGIIGWFLGWLIVGTYVWTGFVKFAFDNNYFLSWSSMAQIRSVFPRVPISIADPYVCFSRHIMSSVIRVSMPNVGLKGPRWLVDKRFRYQVSRSWRRGKVQPQPTWKEVLRKKVSLPDVDCLFSSPRSSWALRM